MVHFFVNIKWLIMYVLTRKGQELRYGEPNTKFRQSFHINSLMKFVHFS